VLAAALAGIVGRAEDGLQIGPRCLVRRDDGELRAMIGSAAAAAARAVVIPGVPATGGSRKVASLSLLMAGTVPSIPDALLPG
jgi:hypothetical protein